jgi:hypothetical protein
MALDADVPPTSTTTTTDEEQSQPQEEEEEEQQHPPPQPQQSSLSSSRSSIGCARYPNPLGSLLQTCAESRNPTLKESPETALQNLIENAIQALDQWYFTALPKQRTACAWTHRTCLRVSTCHEHNSLTITDAGIGMTRADLINVLGVGRPQQQPQSQQQPNRKNHNRKPAKRTGSSATTSTSDEEDNDNDNDNDDEEEDSCENLNATSDENNNDRMQPQIPRCKTNDIGGFYAALCTLGVGVKVGTKVRNVTYGGSI